MLVAKLPTLADDVGTLAVYAVALAGAGAGVTRFVLRGVRKIAAEQDERMNDRVGERVAKELAPVSRQVERYSDDVQRALSEFRAGQAQNNNRFLELWQALGHLGVERTQTQETPS